MNFYAAMSIGNVLRLRPIAVEILEELTGGRYVNQLESTLSQFCKVEEISEEMLLEKLNHLGPSKIDKDWKGTSLYYLVDYLTEQHREFREVDLPLIRELFSKKTKTPNLTGYLFRSIFQKYCAFEEELLWHITKEEDFLFPKILKTEAYLKYRDLLPDTTFRLSNLFGPTPAELPGEKLMHMLSIILNNIWDQLSLGPDAFLNSDIYSKLETLKDKLVAHENVETNVLFPLSIEIETALIAREDLNSRS